MISLVSRRVHLIGIGGIGVSAIARLFLHWGCSTSLTTGGSASSPQAGLARLTASSSVSGSDVKSSEITAELEQLGAQISIGHAAENIPPQAELIVYSPAIPADNPERVEAERRGIPQKSYPEMLGELMAGTYGIAVSGTNGKTTTTALLGHILVEAGLDPTVIVGSKVGNFGGSNLRVGGSAPLATVERYFVVEGCEYRRHFLQLRPRMIVLTNIEVDHLDYFKDFDDIKAAFRECVALLPPDGMLVYNADDPACAEVAGGIYGKKIPYHLGTKHSHILVYRSGGDVVRHCSLQADAVRLVARTPGDGVQTLRIACGGSEWDVPLRLPGEIYAANALAAIAAAHALGIPRERIASAVASFRGTWRRFEIVCGQSGSQDTAREGARGALLDDARDKPLDATRGKIIVSDYAHHPTAVRETIKAAREFFPGRRILVVFQPHQRNRTKNFLNEFVESLALADQVIVCEIFDVAGREARPDSGISSRDIAARLQKTGRPALYAADLVEAERMAREELAAADVALVMGAGDVYTLAQKLC